MHYAKLIQIYQISFILATFSGLIMFSSNIEQMNKIHTIETKTEIHSGVVSSTEDGVNNLQKQPVGKIKAPVIVPKSTSVKIAKPSTTLPTEIKNETPKKIYRDGWNDPRVQYGYDISKGNMDFILTIEAESRWDMNAVGDKGMSFGLCQIHKRFNAKMQKQYRELKTDNEKIKMCYDQYQDWVKRGVIKTRLYGYNYRKARAYLFTIKSL